MIDAFEEILHKKDEFKPALVSFALYFLAFNITIFINANFGFILIFVILLYAGYISEQYFSITSSFIVAFTNLYIFLVISLTQQPYCQIFSSYDYIRQPMIFYITITSYTILGLVTVGAIIRNQTNPYSKTELSQQTKIILNFPLILVLSIVTGFYIMTIIYDNFANPFGILGIFVLIGIVVVTLGLSMKKFLIFLFVSYSLIFFFLSGIQTVCLL